MKPHRALVALVALTIHLLVSAKCTAVEPPYFMFTVSIDRIQRANLDGTGLSTIVSYDPNGDPLTKFDTSYGIAVDSQARNIYWTDINLGTIKRASVDGTNITLVKSGLDPRPFDVAVDAMHGYLYWTEISPGRIMRSNLDGSNTVQLAHIDGAPFLGITVDPADGYIYWAGTQAAVVSASDTIWRASLDGSNQTPLITGLNGARYVAVDTLHDKLYWSIDGVGATSTLQRADTDGTHVQNFIPNRDGLPTGVAVDGANGHVYWAEYFPGSQQSGIVRSNLDGTDITTLTSVPPFHLPHGLALLIPEPATVVLAVVGLLGLAFFARRVRMAAKKVRT